MPTAYSSAEPATPTADDPAVWWQAFRDPVLDDLVARAMAGNLDIQQAASRVKQARAQEQATRAAGGPSVNASAQAGYTRLSSNALPSALANFGTGNTGSGSGGPGIGLAGEDFATFQTGFDAAWELDLFGGQRRANEAAGARVAAAVWSQCDAQVLLASEVANTYQQLRALQRRIAVADESIAAARDLLGFIEVRSAKGLVTTLDARRQQQDIQSQIAQREDLAAQAEVHVHALGTVLGLAPTGLAAQLAAASAAPAAPPDPVAVPAGLPSDLLQRRPDIRASERQLAAATADIGVATADLYPKFSLTGALQLASRSLTHLLETDSITANGAGRLSLPLIGGGASRATVRLREAQANEALLAYQSTVLGALRDVEDALTRLAADRRRAESLRTSLQAARDASETMQVRYRHGLVAYIEVLTARQTALSVQDGLAQAEAAAAQDAIALYKALGGGWDERREQQEVERTRG
jgi:NodT family efflux transporter outer membrane factor (OMF) lipoprotein